MNEKLKKQETKIFGKMIASSFQYSSQDFFVFISNFFMKSNEHIKYIEEEKN